MTIDEVFALPGWKDYLYIIVRHHCIGDLTTEACMRRIFYQDQKDERRFQLLQFWESYVCTKAYLKKKRNTSLVDFYRWCQTIVDEFIEDHFDSVIVDDPLIDVLVI
jgi:hypothetical protein